MATNNQTAPAVDEDLEATPADIVRTMKISTAGQWLVAPVVMVGSAMSAGDAFETLHEHAYMGWIIGIAVDIAMVVWLLISRRLHAVGVSTRWGMALEVITATASTVLNTCSSVIKKQWPLVFLHAPLPLILFCLSMASGAAQRKLHIQRRKKEAAEAARKQRERDEQIREQQADMAERRRQREAEQAEQIRLREVAAQTKLADTQATAAAAAARKLEAQAAADAAKADADKAETARLRAEAKANAQPAPATQKAAPAKKAPLRAVPTGSKQDQARAFILEQWRKESTVPSGSQVDKAIKASGIGSKTLTALRTSGEIPPAGHTGPWPPSAAEKVAAQS